MRIYDSILITGGGGMLAHALSDLLTIRGNRPVSLARRDLDVSDDASLKNAFETHKPTLVLNCAAHTKVDLCEQEREKADAINGYAVGKMAALCWASGAVLVHVSTDFVFDGTGRTPYKTTAPVNPLSAYGKSKLLGETELQKNAPSRWLIIRTAWVYGRHGANFPRTMIQAGRANKPLTVVDDQVGAPTFTGDLAGAIVGLLDTGASGLWNVTNSGQTNWYEFARAALKEFNVPGEISPLSSAEWNAKRPTAAPRPSYSVLDLEPLTRQLGKPMRPWQEALADYHRDVRQDGF